MSQPSPKTIDLLIGVLCLLWGSTWVVIKVGLEDLPPYTSAGIRFAVAGILMVFVAMTLGRRESGERPDLSEDERSQLREIFLQRLDEEDRARAQERIAEREARRAAGEDRGPRAGQGQGGPRGGGGGGGRGSGRIFASLYHTYLLEDSLQIMPGGVELDLLDGDAISDEGGSARHRITAQVGYAKGAIGTFMRADWQSATEVDDGAMRIAASKR